MEVKTEAFPMILCKQHCKHNEVCTYNSNGKKAIIAFRK